MSKKIKRTFSILLVCTIMLTMSFFTGCGVKQSTEETSTVSVAASSETVQEEAAPTLEPVKLKWYVYRDNTMPDDQKVLDKANELISKKINATVEMESFSYGEYPTKMQLLISSGADFDLCFTAGWLLTYSEQATKGAFEPLDALIDQYAPGTKKLIPDFIWKNTKLKDSSGKDTIFGVPCYQISYSQYGIMFKKELVDKYNLQDQIAAVKKQSDLTPIFDIVKKGEPNMPIMKDGPWWLKEMPAEDVYTSVESNYGVLVDKDLKVKDWSDEGIFQKTKADVALAAEWKQKGFFHKDYGLSKDLYPEVQAGKFFAWGDTYKPGVEADLKLRLKYDVVAIPLGVPILSGGSVQNALTAINKNSKNKERAMMLLELMNTDKELYNTLVYGIENEHYKKTGANSIEILPSAADVKYKNNAWQLGCQFNAFTLPGQPDDVWEQTAKANASAVVTSLDGFVGDGNSLKTQQANLNAIFKQYIPVTYGMVNDWEKKLDEMRTRVIKAGMPDMTKEFQRQIDVWTSSKK